MYLSFMYLSFVSFLSFYVNSWKQKGNQELDSWAKNRCHVQEGSELVKVIIKCKELIPKFNKRKKLTVR